MNIIRPAIAILGKTLQILAMLMLLPVLLLLVDTAPNSVVFLLSAVCTGVVGLVLDNTNRNVFQKLTTQKVFLITAANWLGVSVFASLPFMFSSLHLSVVDAIFETVSGITTTGSTVLSGLDSMPRDILLWRSICQWLGGIGIIAMAVTILPFLQIGGMRLFRTESSDWSGKATPRMREQIRYLLLIYLSLSVICAACYWLFGMSPYDAVNHAMTTVSTGGYSTYDASMGHFTSPAILWTAIVFMVLGGIPFILYVPLLARHGTSLFRDSQTRAFLGVILCTGLGMSTYLYISQLFDWHDAMLHGFLNVVSVITTTGFASSDFGQWGTAAAAVFFFLIFIGGCSGSTSGGIKVFRFQLFWLYLKEQMVLSIHPNAVVTLKYNGRPLTGDIVASSISFMYMAMGSYAMLTVILGLCGLDLITSTTGALTALMNVGPGLGDIIGPAGNFSSLPDVAKLALSFGMLLGRLEYLTLYVLFTSLFWRG